MLHLMGQPDFWGRVPAGHRRQYEMVKAQGFEISFFVMGDEEDEEAPTAVALMMPPGAEIYRHSHASERFEVVVRGSMQAGGLKLGPGDCMTARKDELYGPHVAGPEGCVTYEIFSDQKGIYQLSYEMNGEIFTIDSKDIEALKVPGSANRGGQSTTS